MKSNIFLISLISFLLTSCSNGNDDSQDLDQVKVEVPMSHAEREMKEMAEKATQQPQENPYKDAKIEVLVFKNDTVNQQAKYTGYGYAILVFGERQVSQPHKPGMPGLDGFKTEADAKKVGEFVVYKIRNNIMPPSVTVQEMDSLGVLK